MSGDEVKVGMITLLLAQRRANQQPITKIAQLAAEAGINRTMLDRLDAGTLQFIHNVKRVAQVLELTSIGELFGLENKASVLDTIYERPITQAVKLQGLSLRELSRRTHIRRDSLIRLDKGEATYFSLAHILQLCATLQISVDDVLRYKPGLENQENDRTE